jgi:hypothetical protein
MRELHCSQPAGLAEARCLAALPGAHKTQPALAFVQFAKARTNVALDAAVRQRMPTAGWVAGNRLIHAAPDLIFT